MSLALIGPSGKDNQGVGHDETTGGAATTLGDVKIVEVVGFSFFSSAWRSHNEVRIFFYS
jgi:hypothetical protein